MATKSTAPTRKRPRAAVDTTNPDALLHGNAVPQPVGVSDVNPPSAASPGSRPVAAQSRVPLGPGVIAGKHGGHFRPDANFHRCSLSRLRRTRKA